MYQIDRYWLYDFIELFPMKSYKVHLNTIHPQGESEKNIFPGSYLPYVKNKNKKLSSGKLEDIYFQIAYAWVLSWTPYSVCACGNQTLALEQGQDVWNPGVREGAIRWHLWEVVSAPTKQMATHSGCNEA